MPERALKGPKARRLGSFEGFTPQCSESPSYFVLVFLGSRPRMMAEKWTHGRSAEKRVGPLLGLTPPRGATDKGFSITQALCFSRSLSPALLVSQERARGSVRCHRQLSRGSGARSRAALILSFAPPGGHGHSYSESPTGFYRAWESSLTSAARMAPNCSPTLSSVPGTRTREKRVVEGENGTAGRRPV